MILAQRDPALAQAFEALYQRAAREQLWGAERPSPTASACLPTSDHW